MRRALSLMAAQAVLVTLAGCASPHQFDGSVATASMPVGSCHRFSDPFELYVASDVAPPVPCDGPHQTETFAFAKAPPVMAAMAERPERPADLAKGVCESAGYRRLRDYLGADELDSQFGVVLWTKYPTRHEWAAGLRVVRCDLIPAYQGGPTGPGVSRPMRGVLRRADSAAFRHCRDGLREVTCDHPHTAEEVGGWIGVPGKRYPGAKRASRQIYDQCWRNAERYTSDGLDRDGLSITASRLTADQWRKGVRTGDCWIGSANRRTTGTLRAGLTEATIR